MTIFCEEAGPLKDVIVTVGINLLLVHLLITKPWHESKGKVRIGELLQVNVVNLVIHQEGRFLVRWLERHRVVNWKVGRREHQDSPILC